MEKQLKFLPVQSFVESSFFTKLAELKLDEFKLDSAERKVIAFQVHPNKLNKFHDKTVVNLDYNSFDEEGKQSESSVYLRGTLLNVNTIEQFKSINKQEMIKQWGTKIHEAIVSKRDLRCGDLNRFFVLAFSDIKKYKFYYWCAFPTLKSSWTVSGVKSDVQEGHLEIIRKSLETTNPDLFFQITDNEVTSLADITLSGKGPFVFIDSTLNKESTPSVQLKNYLYFLADRGVTDAEVIVFRKDNKSFKLSLTLDVTSFKKGVMPSISGWERSNDGKLRAKVADLGSLIDPYQLANQAVDLNLKLMKWRIAPDLNLEIIKSQRVLLLGAGTLGSYVARVLMGWGVREIDFVDNGRVSYSNPVRQPLFNFEDCYSDGGSGAFKATKAAEELKRIFPGVSSKGINMEVPMIGHPVTEQHKAHYDKLISLFDSHDVVFLLMDSRESRWLPTLLGTAKNKLVINAALGFDSYVVMRHASNAAGPRLGCYYCNDVVAPNDSLSDRSLDQMCTVTRPGVAMMASALAVELLVSVLQHPDRQNAGVSSSKMGEVPHQIRGFLHNFSQIKLETPAYPHCSACSELVVDHFHEHGWNFVSKCLSDTKYLEEICGLSKVQEEAELASESLLKDLELSDGDEDWIE